MRTAMSRNIFIIDFCLWFMHCVYIIYNTILHSSINYTAYVKMLSLIDWVFWLLHLVTFMWFPSCCHLGCSFGFMFWGVQSSKFTCYSIKLKNIWLLKKNQSYVLWKWVWFHHSLVAFPTYICTMPPLQSMTWRGKARLGKEMEDFQSVVKIIALG